MKWMLFVLIPVFFANQTPVEKYLEPRQAAKLEKFISDFLKCENHQEKKIIIDFSKISHVDEDPAQEFLRISCENKVYYVLFNQAPSMKNIFDYACIIDEEGMVRKVKVLIYRESHGRQIGSLRWLNQFVDHRISEYKSEDVNVDGISEATISVNSMRDAVFTDMKLLSEHYAELFRL